MGFFRFPHTPHLAWLGTGVPRDDKVLTPGELRELLGHEVVVEEKVDGANVGLSVDAEGTLRAQNRGTYLARENSQPQFKPLFRWLATRAPGLSAALRPGLMIFGEWCYAVHSIRYTRLPDWFLVFDVYDRGTGSFWSTVRRDALARDLALSVVPSLGKGHFELPGLRALLGTSRLTDGPAEGLYVRREAGGTLLSRAKLVRPEFIQAIDTHWSRRALEANALGTC